MVSGARSLEVRQDESIVSRPSGVDGGVEKVTFCCSLCRKME